MRRLDYAAVVGLGTLGGELGADLGRQGSQVIGVDTDEKARERALKTGCFSKVLAEITQIPHNVNVVFEAVYEDRSLKAHVLGQLSEVVDHDTYIAMASSTIPSSTLADKVENPSRLMNCHTLPDLKTRRFAELQGPGNYTEDAALAIMASEMRKKQYAVSIVNGESPGFIFNQIWHNVMFKMFEQMTEKERSYEEIESAWRYYFGMPYGGIMAMDLIGHDTLYKVFTQVDAKIGVGIPQVIADFYSNQTYGLKSGQGFFTYETPDLDGLHKAAREFKSKVRKKVRKEIGEEIWTVIKQGAETLIQNGQSRGAVGRAIREGYPITEKRLLKELESMGL